MSKPKHGPWFVDNNTLGHFTIVDNEYAVATLSNRYDSKETAQLLAASPEMLYALKLAHEILCEKVYDPNGNHKSGAIILIEAAIKKATGG